MRSTSRADTSSPSTDNQIMSIKSHYIDTSRSARCHKATKPLNPAALRASRAWPYGCWVSLNFFPEQYPGLLGSSDERLARYPWWFFSTDYGKACFDCCEPRLALRPRPIPQQNFGRVGYRSNNSVAIDPAGLNDDGLSETFRTHDSLQEQDMLASADPLRHIKRPQVTEGIRLAQKLPPRWTLASASAVGLGPDFEERIANSGVTQ